jgi:hypothetical protein
MLVAEPGDKHGSFVGRIAVVQAQTLKRSKKSRLLCRRRKRSVALDHVIIELPVCVFGCISNVYSEYLAEYVLVMHITKKVLI